MIHVLTHAFTLVFLPYMMYFRYRRHLGIYDVEEYMTYLSAFVVPVMVVCCCSLFSLFNRYQHCMWTRNRLRVKPSLIFSAPYQLITSLVFKGCHCCVMEGWQHTTLHVFHKVDMTSCDGHVLYIIIISRGPSTGSLTGSFLLGDALQLCRISTGFKQSIFHGDTESSHRPQLNSAHHGTMTSRTARQQCRS